MPSAFVKLVKPLLAIFIRPLPRVPDPEVAVRILSLVSGGDCCSVHYLPSIFSSRRIEFEQPALCGNPYRGEAKSRISSFSSSTAI